MQADHIPGMNHSRDTRGATNTSAAATKTGPTGAARSGFDSPASLRTYELLSESSCSTSTWQPAFAAPAHRHAASSHAEPSLTPLAHTQTASAQYAGQIRSERQIQRSSSPGVGVGGATQGAGPGFRAVLGQGLDVDLDKQYEYGRLLRKAASQSFKSGVSSSLASPSMAAAGTGTSVGAGAGVGVSRARTVLDSPYRETRPASRSSLGRGTGYGDKQYSGGHKRYTLSVSTSPSQTETPPSRNGAQGHKHGRASIGSTPRQRVSVGSLHIQHQVRSVMLPSDGYGMSYASDDASARQERGMSGVVPGTGGASVGVDERRGVSIGGQRPAETSTASYTRQSPAAESNSVYSPAANARRVSQYGLSAPSWRNQNLTPSLAVGSDAESGPRGKMEDRNRPSSYLRSGPRLTKYADFDFDALDSGLDVALTLDNSGGDGANSLLGTINSKQGKSGTGKSILGAWTANIGQSVGRRGRGEELESFLDLGMGEKGRYGGKAGTGVRDRDGSDGGIDTSNNTRAAAGFGASAGKMMKLSAGAAGKWLANVGIGAATANDYRAQSQEDESDLQSFFDGYSSRTRTSKFGSTTKDKGKDRPTRHDDQAYAHAHARDKVNSMAPSTYSAISAPLSVSNSTTLSPSPSTDSRWSIGTTRRAHAERLLPSSAVRSDSKTLLQGINIGLDRLGAGDRLGVSLGLGVGSEHRDGQDGGSRGYGAGRTERAISVGTVLEAETGGLGLYAINGTGMDESGSDSSLGTGSADSIGSGQGVHVMVGTRAEGDQASVISGAGTGSRSALSDQIITPDLSVSYSGPSEYVSVKPPHTQATPDGQVAKVQNGHTADGDRGRVDQNNLSVQTPNKQPFASGSPGFGLISLEAAQERERQRSRSGHTSPFAYTAEEVQGQGQGHTPRASTSTARTTATSVHTNSGVATGNSKMPSVPRSSTSTIAQKIKSKKSLIALIKSATSSAAATFGASSAPAASGQTGAAGAGGGVKGSSGMSTPIVPPLPTPYARRTDAILIKGLIGNPIPLIHSLEGDGARTLPDRMTRADQHGGARGTKGGGMEEYGDEMEEVDDFRADGADELGPGGYSAGLLSPLPHATPLHLAGLGSVQPKLELRPVSMNFAHVMPEGYLVIDYADAEPMPSIGAAGSGAAPHAITSGNFENGIQSDKGRDDSSVLTAPSSSSLSTSSSAYPPALDLSLPPSGPSVTTSAANPAHTTAEALERAQREINNLRKLHAMQISELSSQLREARDELASLRTEHLDVLEELAETAAIAASAVTKQHAQARHGAGGERGEYGWKPKEGGCAICGCMCGIHRNGGDEKVDAAMVAGENLMGSPSTRQLGDKPQTQSHTQGQMQGRTRTHRSQKLYGQSVAATPGRTRSGTLKTAGVAGNGNSSTARQRSAAVEGRSTDVLVERDRNAVYPALAAPPMGTSPSGGGQGLRSPSAPGQSQSHVSAQGEGYKKTGVMDRARVKTGGARGFGTGSLYQWE